MRMKCRRGMTNKPMLVFGGGERRCQKWRIRYYLLMCIGIGAFFLSMQPSQGSHLPISYLRSQEQEGGEGTGEDVVFQNVGSSEAEITTVESLLQNGESEGDNTDTTIESTSTTTTTAASSSSSTTTTTTTTPTTTSSTTKKTSTTPTPTSSTTAQARIGEVIVEKTDKLGPNGKRYLDLSATCDSSQLVVFSQFASNFKGRIYAYGYPDEIECGFKAVSSPSENATFTLPLGQCGVQMMAPDPEFESPKRHEVTLYIQYSSFLQQVIDDKVSVSCVEVQKSPMEESMQTLDFSSLPAFSSRQGRRMNLKETKAVKASPSPQTRITTKIGESWMEILHGKDPSPKSRKMLPVAVGQDVTLVISTKVMRGYDARIVNCSANDGSRLGSVDGYRSQQILDSAGCSVDTTLVPNFRRRRLPIESRNRMITLHFATFPAFKFPERDHLHIKCQVAYCQGPCPHESCDSGLNHFGTWREKYGRIADALIDTSEIVNSVEVFAPELEDNTAGHFERHQSLVPLGGSATDVSLSPQSRQMRFSDSKSEGFRDSDSSGKQNNNNFLSGGSVCVSPGSVILALVVLGVVLVVSATATLWFALKRSEARKYRQAIKHAPFQHAGPQPYYRFSHW